MANTLDRPSVVVAGLGYSRCMVLERESLVQNDALICLYRYSAQFI